MAEGGTGCREMEEDHQPVVESGTRNFARKGRSLMSFDSFDSLDMVQDCRGWLTLSETGERFWGVAAGKMLGLFESPEGETPKMVLTLTNYLLEEAVKDAAIADRCGVDDDGHSPDDPGISAECDHAKKCYVLELKPTLQEDRPYLFTVPTEEEFSLWRQILLTATNNTPTPNKNRTAVTKQKSFDECRRMDSGLGEDLECSVSAWRKQVREDGLPGVTPKLLVQRSTESDSPSRDVSRGSSFISLNDDLADSRSMSDSASGDNSSTVNISDFADSDNCSYGRQSLSDSVFLGASQEWDPTHWNESKDRECFISDGESAYTNLQTPSSMSSAGDVVEGFHSSDRTVINKVSKLVQRVGLNLRPRVSSGLALAHLPEVKMSGPMRKKGKARWYALSGSCLYCFKTKSPEAKVETIFDLASYSVAMATEEKEDGQSIALLKLTHSTGKKVLLAVNSTETAQLWFSYLQDAIQEAAASSMVSRSDSQKSNSSTNSSSNPQSPRPTSMSSRLSRQSFEESYGFFERQSSLRAERDALQNAISETSRPRKQDSNSGNSVSTGERKESRSLSDVGSAPSSAGSTWESTDDLNLERKTGNPARATVKSSSVRASRPSKRSTKRMPIPAADVVDPSQTGCLHVYAPHRGTWKKTWAVLKDNWLYLYKIPTDTETADVIDLRNSTVQRDRTIGVAAPLTQHKFSFSITHKDDSDAIILMGDSDKETRVWMDTMKSNVQSQGTSPMLDSLNLACSCSQHPLDPSEKRCLEQAELQKQQLLMEMLQQQQLANSGQQGAPTSPQSPSDLSDDPELAKKKNKIFSKYQKANAEEEEELVRLMTILNRRRVSAQVKVDALQKTIGSKTKRRLERIGSVEEHAMEDQIRVLNAKLKGINTEMNAKSLQKTSRLQALKEKKDLELQLLEQQERLSRYRRLAQDALQVTMNQSVALGGLEEENLDEETGSSEEAIESGSVESLKDQSGVPADEMDRHSLVQETIADRDEQRLCLAVPQETADPAPQHSPSTRRKRLLPTLPNKNGKPLRDSLISDELKGKEDICRLEERRHSPVLCAANLGHRNTAGDSPPEKKSSPLARLRKISIGTKTSPDSTPKEPRRRKKSWGLKPSISFDDKLSLALGDETSSLQHSSSYTDLRATKASPILQRAAAVDHSEGKSPSQQRRRRKISVPIRMPSMENLFTSSSSKASTKEKMSPRKNGSSKESPPNTPSRTGSAHFQAGHTKLKFTPSNSPDINGNVTQLAREERSKRKGQPLKDDIDPEVLRDIEEFEMMALKALQEAGWVFRS